MFGRGSRVRRPLIPPDDPDDSAQPVPESGNAEVPPAQEAASVLPTDGVAAQPEPAADDDAPAAAPPAAAAADAPPETEAAPAPGNPAEPDAAAQAPFAPAQHAPSPEQYQGYPPPWAAPQPSADLPFAQPPWPPAPFPGPGGSGAFPGFQSPYAPPNPYAAAPAGYPQPYGQQAPVWPGHPQQAPAEPWAGPQWTGGQQAYYPAGTGEPIGAYTQGNEWSHDAALAAAWDQNAPRLPHPYSAQQSVPDVDDASRVRDSEQNAGPNEDAYVDSRQQQAGGDDGEARQEETEEYIPRQFLRKKQSAENDECTPLRTQQPAANQPETGPTGAPAQGNEWQQHDAASAATGAQTAQPETHPDTDGSVQQSPPEVVDGRASEQNVGDSEAAYVPRRQQHYGGGEARHEETAEYVPRQFLRKKQSAENDEYVPRSLRAQQPAGKPEAEGYVPRQLLLKRESDDIPPPSAVDDKQDAAADSPPDHGGGGDPIVAKPPEMQGTAEEQEPTTANEGPPAAASAVSSPLVRNGEARCDDSDVMHTVPESTAQEDSGPEAAGRGEPSQGDATPRDAPNGHSGQPSATAGFDGAAAGLAGPPSSQAATPLREATPRELPSNEHLGRLSPPPAAGYNGAEATAPGSPSAAPGGGTTPPGVALGASPSACEAACPEPPAGGGLELCALPSELFTQLDADGAGTAPAAEKRAAAGDAPEPAPSTPPPPPLSAGGGRPAAPEPVAVPAEVEQFLNALPSPAAGAPPNGWLVTPYEYYFPGQDPVPSGEGTLVRYVVRPTNKMDYNSPLFSNILGDAVQLLLPKAPVVSKSRDVQTEFTSAQLQALQEECDTLRRDLQMSDESGEEDEEPGHTGSYRMPAIAYPSRDERLDEAPDAQHPVETEPSGVVGDDPLHSWVPAVTGERPRPPMQPPVDSFVSDRFQASMAVTEASVHSLGHEAGMAHVPSFSEATTRSMRRRDRNSRATATCPSPFCQKVNLVDVPAACFPTAAVDRAAGSQQQAPGPGATASEAHLFGKRAHSKRDSSALATTVRYCGACGCHLNAALPDGAMEEIRALRKKLAAYKHEMLKMEATIASMKQTLPANGAVPMVQWNPLYKPAAERDEELRAATAGDRPTARQLVEFRKKPLQQIRADASVSAVGVGKLEAGEHRAKTENRGLQRRRREMTVLAAQTERARQGMYGNPAALFAAAECGAASAFASLRRADPSLSGLAGCLDPLGRTPLNVAAQYGHLAVVCACLERPPGPPAPDADELMAAVFPAAPDGPSVLHSAVLSGKAVLVEWVLKRFLTHPMLPALLCTPYPSFQTAARPRDAGLPNTVFDVAEFCEYAHLVSILETYAYQMVLALRKKERVLRLAGAGSPSGRGRGAPEEAAGFVGPLTRAIRNQKLHLKLVRGGFAFSDGSTEARSPALTN
ncbi:hypothetical protein DIPPA_23538 [Diplonema papillatum]|nr:hypothetical protein DIPPA_23538 [Diplonema papillatum]